MTEHTTSRPEPGAPAPLALVIAAQVVAACALGAIAAYAGTLIGGLIVPADPSGGFRDVVAQLAGLIVLYPIGLCAGLWAAGALLGRPGSRWASLAGAYLGVGIGLLLAPLFVSGQAPLGWALLLALSLLGALAGYHRVYRRAGRR
jgi:hypothetical protein